MKTGNVIEKIKQYFLLALFDCTLYTPESCIVYTPESCKLYTPESCTVYSVQLRAHLIFCNFELFFNILRIYILFFVDFKYFKKINK